MKRNIFMVLAGFSTGMAIYSLVSLINKTAKPIDFYILILYGIALCIVGVVIEVRNK